jgi:predicted RNA-binding Zn-ribbon protein involved in translation (DUF1610 family)
MDDHCPKCGNEIYRPYTYCNACGWEKSEKEEKSKKKKREEKVTSEKKSKKLGKKEISKKREIDKASVPLKITCKCGGVIRIKSKKRPLKFQCPKCGKSGTLKDTSPVSKSTVPKSDKKLSKKSSGKSFDRSKYKSKMKRPPKDDFEKKSRFDDFDEYENEDFEDYEDDEFEEFEDFTPKTKAKAVRKKGTSHRQDSDADFGQRPSYDQPRKVKKRPKHKTPTSAYTKKHVKGKCSWCNSRNIRYFEDGSGRCSNCGKEFNWSGGPSRIQKKEYLCQRCKEPLEYIEEYDSWYCYSCNEYA